MDIAKILFTVRIIPLIAALVGSAVADKVLCRRDNMIAFQPIGAADRSLNALNQLPGVGSLRRFYLKGRDYGSRPNQYYAEKLSPQEYYYVREPRLCPKS